MKSLTAEQRERLRHKRNRGMVSVHDLAAILNANKFDIFQAQVGQSVPNEVHDALVQWIVRDDEKYWL